MREGRGVPRNGLLGRPRNTGFEIYGQKRGATPKKVNRVNGKFKRDLCFRGNITQQSKERCRLRDNSGDQSLEEAGRARTNSEKTF